jgi:hypothetical protein
VGIALETFLGHVIREVGRHGLTFVPQSRAEKVWLLINDVGQGALRTKYPSIVDSGVILQYSTVMFLTRVTPSLTKIAIDLFLVGVFALV